MIQTFTFTLGRYLCIAKRSHRAPRWIGAEIIRSTQTLHLGFWRARVRIGPYCETFPPPVPL